MEGGGEGMVAVIRGLQDAGLEVTLMNGETGSNRASVYAPRTSFPLPLPLSPSTNTEGTNTKALITSNTSAQVCDDRYTSSYQLAHCNKRPSSPPVLLPEFPLRRDTVKNHRNFDVGWEKYGTIGCRERPTSSLRAAGTSSPYKTSFTYPDRSTSTFDTRASEAFASSLRRYSLSPETPSAELVQKLLSYTLNKNIENAKATRPSLKDKMDADKSKFKDKDIQTYTRARPKTKESFIEELKTKSVKRMRIQSPIKDGGDKRYKDSQLNETYDYLRSTSPKYYAKGAEVRYLNDVSKCIKETIKQIVDESKPEICSQMHNRYLAHRKRCQSKVSKQHGESSNAHSQAFVPEDSSIGTKDTSMKICIPTCPFLTPPCCYCKKQMSIPRQNSEEEFGRKLSEKVGNWLLNIPAYANMSAQDKQKRIDMMENLANTLAALKGDENIEEKSRNQIEKCLDSLPMWLPRSRSDQDDFKKLIADNLMNSLKKVFDGTDKIDDEINKWVDSIKFKSRDSLGVNVDKNKIYNSIADRLKPLIIDKHNDDNYHEILKSEVLEILENLPIVIMENKEQYLDKLADKLINAIENVTPSEIQIKGDEFDNKVSQIIKDLKFKKRDSQGEKVDKQKIADDFANRLRLIASNRPEDNDEYHEVLKNEIANIFADLPIEVQGNKDKYIDKLASKITNLVEKIPASKIKLTDKFDEAILQWIEDIKFKKRDSLGNVVDKRKIANTFSDRLKSLATDRPEHDEDYHDVLKNEIIDILDELPVEIVGNKEQFVDKLASKLINKITKIPASEIKLKTDKFDEQISNWIDDLKFKKRDSMGNKIDKRKIANTFSDRLKSLAIERPEDDKEYHEALKNEIIEILDELPIEIVGNKEQFVDKLACKLIDKITKIPASEIKPKTDKFNEQISNWIDDIKFKNRDSMGYVVDKRKIANTVSDRLKSLAIERPQDDKEYQAALKNEIIEILDELPIEIVGNKEQFVDKLASKLLYKITKIPASEIKPKADKFDKQITNWIDDIKFKKRDSMGNVDKRKKSNTVSDRLKSLAIDRPEEDEEYHEILKNEIIEILDELPIEIVGNNEQFVDKLASKLINKITKIPASEIKSKTDKFDEQISNWIDDIKFKKRDSMGNVVDKRKIVNTFSDRLKSLAIERSEDDEEYHEILKNKIIDILEELPIEIVGNKEQFVDKLASKIKKIPVSEIKPKQIRSEQKSPFQDDIIDWLRHIPELLAVADTRNKENNLMVENLGKKLQTVTSKGKIDENIQNKMGDEILKWMKSALTKANAHIDSKIKSLLVEKLVSKLSNSQDTYKNVDTKSDTESFAKEISDWLDDIPELSVGSKSEKNKMVQDLVRKIQEIKSENVEDDDELRDEIMSWLTTESEKKGTRIDFRTKEKLADKLGESLFSAQRKNRRSSIGLPDKKRRSFDANEDVFSKEIQSWLDKIPELSGNEEQKNIMTDNLAKKMQELQSKGVTDEEEYQDEITEWLLTKAEKKGLQLDIREKDDLVNQLAEKISKVKPPVLSSEEYQDKVYMQIWDRLKDIPEMEETEKNKQLIKELTNNIEKISNKHGEKVTDDIIQKEVTAWLDDFLDKSGVHIDPKDKYKLDKDLTSKVKCILKPNAKYNETKQMISNEVSSIIDSSTSKLNPKGKKNVERRVSALLAKNMNNVLSPNNNRIKTNIMKILDQETNVPNEEAEKLAESFISSAKRISDVSYKSSLKSELHDEVREVIKEKVRNAFADFEISYPDQIINDITELLEEQVLNGVDTKIIKKKIMDILETTNLSKEDAGNLTMRLTLQALDLSSIRNYTDTTLPSEFTLTEKENFEASAIRDITEFMDDLLGKINPKYRRKMKTAAQKLAERIGDAISDPDKTVQDKEDILKSEVSNFLSNFSVPVNEYGPVLANQLRNLAATSTPRQSEQNYSFYPRRSSFTVDDNLTSNLENIIRNWILDLPIRLEDNTLLDHIASELANDITDRQKYLQNHPDIVPTDEEKLEFLKYQVFRAMGKSIEAKDLSTVMYQTGSLLSQIDSAVAPLHSAPGEVDISDHFFDEISKWVEDISDDIKEKYSGYNKRQEIAKELADKIHKKGKLGENINDEINEWLKRIIKETNQHNIESMSDDLKMKLQMKGLTKEIADATSQSTGYDQIQQNTSQFLEENLSTGISDWLQSLPLYQRRTSKEKRIQEKIVQDIIEDLKKIIVTEQDGTDIDIQILQAVKNHLEKFPMEKELKADKAYIEKVAAQLVDYLNNMQIFQNISSRQFIRPYEYLISTLNDWMRPLPIDTSSFNSQDIDTLKMDFLNRLNQILKDSPQLDDQTVKDEIKQFIENLPIYKNKKQDSKFITKKVEELFKNILGTPFLCKPSRPTISRDIVESAVKDWSEKLPFTSGKPPKNVSDKIQNFTADISNVLNDTNATAVDNYKYNLLDKTVDFLKQLPIQLDNLSSDDLRKLADDLLTTIKNKAAGLSPKPRSKNAADTLYDNISTWCDDLPIPEGNTAEEKEKVNTMKQNLASRLMNKIGELNMDPEIFNDDFLYEQLLQEEIDDLLNDLPPIPEIENNLESIKENLMTKIKEAKQKTEDELAGQTYKQKLRETISNSLPFDVSMQSEEPESFEVLVDNLADAYVDLHFVTDNKDQKAEYKKRIAGEITKYCNDYLKRHPEAPLDSIKINQDLYSALKNIPTPKEEIMRSEAEHVRMKDEINDWIKELPVIEGSGPQQVQKNKMASVLAKKLLEIEKEKKDNPEFDFEEKQQKEISKLLKKLPVKPGQEAEIDDMIKRLIDKLKDTEQSRKISASLTRLSLDLSPEQWQSESVTEGSTESSEEQLCPYHLKHKSMPSKHTCNYKPICPRSTLSTEDKAHLERIRIRTPLPGCRLIQRECSCKDASVNPAPIDASSQTDVGPNLPNICSILSSRTSPCQPIESQLEVSPQIIIKEYLWDSGTSKLLGPVYRLPRVELDTSNSSMPSLQRPLQKSVSIQPSPCVIPERPCPQQLSPPIPCNLTKSPRPLPQQLSTPKPGISSPRTVIPSLSSNDCANRSVNTVPCTPFTPCLPPPCPSPPCSPREMPYCSTPRRTVIRDQNTPFRQPCFQPSFSKTCSPDRESDVNTSKDFPRVINLGSFDNKPRSPCQNPCLRRRIQDEERLSDYNDCQNFRRKIYRPPDKPCFREPVNECRTRYPCVPRNVCRQRFNIHNTPCQSSENVRQCSKCCGMPCPHPTGRFFR